MKKLKELGEVNKLYDVIASFYYCHDAYSGDDYLCRNYADIKQKGSLKETVDAYVIMINPGSCKPLKGDGLINSQCNCNPESAVLVEAKSDPAMQRVMQIMDAVGFEKVRIINLLDCKEPDSKKLDKFLDSVTDLRLCIFENSRRSELQKLTKDDAPYIVAWGLDDALNEYKQLAEKFLEGRKIVGERGKELGYYYLKPKRGKEKEDQIKHSIIEQIQALES